MTGQQEMFPRHVGYGGKKAAEIVGISYRQLDYWARTDLVRPSLTDAAGSGSRRKYSYQDLLELKLVKSLLDGGVNLEKVRKAFTYLRNELGEDPASVSLIIDGDQVVLTRDGNELIDIVQKGQGVLNVLALSNVVDQVEASITELFPEGTPSSAEGPPATAEAAAEP
jgi:DNA-binding transcriptional MerR regulator